MSLLNLVENGISFSIYLKMKMSREIIDINETNENGDTATHILVRKGDIESINILINLGSNLNIINNEGETPLIIAVNSGRYEIIELLIKSGASVNLYKKIPLIWVSFLKEDLRMFKILLKGEVDFSYEYEKKSLLFEILNKKMSEYILPLYDGGYDVNEVFNEKDNEDIFSLHYAIKLGNISCLKKLLQTNVDMTVYDKFNKNSYEISKKKDDDIFNLLIENTVSKSKNGKNTINNLIIDNKIEILGILYDNGLNFDTVDEMGKSPLITAVESNNLDIVGNLIYDAEVDMEYKDKDGYTATFLAAKKKYYDIMDCLIEAGAEYEIEDKKGTTLLKYLIINKDFEGLNILIKYDIDIDKKYNEDYPINFAISKNNLKILELLLNTSKNLDIYQTEKLSLKKAIRNMFFDGVKLLIEYGFNLEVIDKKDNCILYHAFSAMDKKILKYLIEKGISINEDKIIKILFKFLENSDFIFFEFLIDFCEEENIFINLNKKIENLTLLETSIKEDNKDFFDLLLKKGVDLNIFDKIPLLHYACFFGRTEMAQMLLEKNVDINELTQFGYTAVYTAIRFGKDECLLLLVSAGADVNKTGEGNCSPIEAAIEYNKHRFINLLFSNGANVGIKNDKGDSLLHKSAKFGYELCVKELLNVGLNINQRNLEGKTPIFFAIEYKNLNCVMEMVKLGADINFKDNNGFTLLHSSCRIGFIPGIKYLLDSGFNINVRSNSGISPLSTLARFNRDNCIYLLADRGANIEQISYGGDSAIMTAVTHGNLDSVKALINCGAHVSKKDRNNRTLIEISKINKRHEVTEFLRDIKRPGKVDSSWHNIDECPICLNPIQQKKIVKGCNKCHHIFHATCFSEWIDTNNRCPFCNSTNKREYTDLIR